MEHRRAGSQDDVLVVGAGPLGLCTAQALAVRTSKTIHLVDANNPLTGAFGSLSAACPYAAGQIIIHSFEPDTYAMELGRRTAATLRELAAARYIKVYPRPWLVCAGKSNDALDEVVRATLDGALGDGLLEGCTRVSGNALTDIPGIRSENIEFAVRDDGAMAMDPRAFVGALARWAVEMENVEAHFGYTLDSYDGDAFVARSDDESISIHAGAVILCTGVHRMLFPNVIPLTRPVHLHVFDHRSPAHLPTLEYSVAGETTVARYEGFGERRHTITPHLPEHARAFDINALLTDVPGLRRQLDTHFDSAEEAEARGDKSLEALGALQRRFIKPELLMSEAECPLGITESRVAQYVRCEGTSEPVIDRLDTPLPALYLQPSSGRGLNQCAALGEDAAAKLLDMI